MLTILEDDVTAENRFVFSDTEDFAGTTPAEKLSLHPAIRLDPGFLITELLDMKYTWFHEQWLQFQMQNRLSLILAPRYHGKSWICNVAYCIWRILLDPDIRILIVSDTAAQAEAFGRLIKEHLQGDTITAIFGNQVGEKWTEKEYTVRGRRKKFTEATVTCMGVGGPIISKHYDIVMLDDIVSLDNSETAYQRRKTLKWYQTSLLGCVKLERDEVHILGTRYAPEDFYGHIIKEETAALKHGGNRVYSVLLSKAIGPGDQALWEGTGSECWSINALKMQRAHMTRERFALQFQNDARLAAGAYFKKEWMRYYHSLPPAVSITRGVDPQVKFKEKNDYFANVGILASKLADGMHYYVLPDIFRGRPTFKEKTNICINLHERSGAHITVVEDVGAQAWLAENIRDLAPRIVVVDEPSTKDKSIRYGPLQVLMENGYLHFPKNCPMADELINEMLLYPSEHDDLIDALEKAVAVAARRATGMGFYQHDNVRGEMAGIREKQF